MATSLSQIHVGAMDNELIIIASGAGPISSELFHGKNGFADPVSYNLNSPGHILPPGNYNLTFVGINWGGPWNFNITTTPPTNPPLTASGTGTVGVVWNRTIPITVP
jgi:hypothetical protein